MTTLSKSVECLGSTTPQKAGAVSGNSDLRLDLKERTHALLEGLKLVLLEHNMPQEMVNKYRDQLIDHLKKIDFLTFYGGSRAELKRIKKMRKEPLTEDEEFDMLLAEEIWVEECKYLLTFPMAKYLKNDPPKIPLSGGFQPKGAVRRWMRSRLNAFNRKNTHLWYSWFQAKRACLPFSDGQVSRLFDEHFEALTATDPYYKSPNNILSMHDIFSDETFMHVLDSVQEKTMDFIDADWTKCPTNANACWESTRSGGGKIATLLRATNTVYIDGITSVSRHDLHSLSYSPVKRMKNGSLKFNCITKTEITSEWEDWDSLKLIDDEICLSGGDDFSLWTMERGEAPFRKLSYYEDGVQIAVEDPDFDRREWDRNNPPPQYSAKRLKKDRVLPCLVYGVLEPNKCRMISKGQAIAYQMAKPLQEIWLRSIQNFPCFKLTGRPFCPTDIYQLLEKCESKGSEWFSIDYSAATDGLSWKYSEMIINHLIRYIPERLRWLVKLVLGPHDLWYPNRRTHVPEFRGRQTNGQLMGSILSFPILCLANLGVYLQTTREWQKGWTHEERLRHVLINGDDMLYNSPTELRLEDSRLVNLWDRHTRNGRAVGLEMSIGKAYHNSAYCNINSTSVIYDLRKRCYKRETIDTSSFESSYVEQGRLYGPGTEHPLVVPFLNVGLMLNRHKVQRSDKPPDQERKEWVDKAVKKYKFLGYNSQRIREEIHSDIASYERFIGLEDKKILRCYAESHTHEDSRKGIVENIQLALEGCLNEKKRRSALDFILKHHIDEIRRQTTVPCRTRKGKTLLSIRNLFLPLNLFGFGITPPLGYRYQVTKIQKCMARTDLEDWYYPFSFEARPLNNLFEIKKVLDLRVEPYMKPVDLFFKEIKSVNDYYCEGSGFRMRRSEMEEFGIKIPVSPWSHCVSD